MNNSFNGVIRKAIIDWITELKRIVMEPDKAGKRYVMLEKCLMECVGSILVESSEEENEYICNEIYKSIDREDTYMAIALFSFLIKIKPNPIFLEEFIYLIIANKELSLENKNFLFYQIEHMVFMNRCFEIREILVAKWKLLEQICDAIESKLTTSLERIPEKELNHEMALVITEQFLDTTHGPTKTALDRCCVLKQELGKQVLLINTAEISSVKGRIPFWERREGCHDETQLEKEFQEWKNVKIPYLQCEQVLPDVEYEEALLQMVMKLKPSIVINIGGNSVFAGLVDKMIPVLSIGTTPSGLSSCLTSFQTYGGKINGIWEKVLVDVDRSMKHVIEGRFTYGINEQQEVITRKQFGIPEGQFVLLVVGVRLDTEITEEFIDMLKTVLNEKIGVAFLGIFELFHEYKKKYPEIASYMYNFGTSKDVLSRMEICDLYINPIRKGGGGSAIEMMSKKKPAISVSFGDVAGIIGDEFCCKDYDEMGEIIKHYANDKEFYAQKSELALKVVEECLDSKTEFVRILGEYEKRKAQIV